MKLAPSGDSVDEVIEDPAGRIVVRLKVEEMVFFHDPLEVEDREEDAEGDRLTECWECRLPKVEMTG